MEVSTRTDWLEVRHSGPNRQPLSTNTNQHSIIYYAFHLHVGAAHTVVVYARLIMVNTHHSTTVRDAFPSRCPRCVSYCCAIHLKHAPLKRSSRWVNYPTLDSSSTHIYNPSTSMKKLNTNQRRQLAFVVRAHVLLNTIFTTNYIHNVIVLTI